MWQEPGLRWMGFTLSLIWALAPLAVRWLDQPVAREEQLLTPVEEENCGFWPDKFGRFMRIMPVLKITFCHRIMCKSSLQTELRIVRLQPISVFCLTAALAARDFGFIDTPELVERLERTVGTVERLDKWNGHLYNWYDTVSLGVLPPAYVSTVDSGNFVASLMTVKQG